MKRIIIPVLMLSVLVLVCSCSSCSSDKKKNDYVEPLIPEAEMQYKSEDTLNINSLIDQYMGLMAENKVDDAINMLHLLKDGEIVPLDGKQLKEFKTAWSKMHVYGVKKKGFMLHSDKNNDVKILLQIMPNGDLDKEIGVAAQHINPVYKEGQWYLTLYDPQAEGVYDIFDESNTKGNVGVVKQ